MTELAIIADDLTGALDAAAPFAACGMKTVVALSAAALPDALAAAAAVVAVSTDSREVPADVARRRVEAALRHLPEGIGRFKKIDSRLKGNLGAELDAFEFDRALVVPAIPVLGRFVRGGMLVGFGIDSPIDIAQRLGDHAGKAVVPDVSSQLDIGVAVENSDGDLLVGARGLAEAVARRMAPHGAVAEPAFGYSRVVIVIGSRDPITLAQVERLRAERPDMVYVEAPDGRPAGRIEAGDALVMIHATPGSAPSAPDVVARRLATALNGAGPLQDALLIVSGGATAQAVLERLGVDIVEVLGEALPGLPIARANGFKLITKSGGFGRPDALVRILENRKQVAAVGMR